MGEKMMGTDKAIVKNKNRFNKYEFVEKFTKTKHKKQAAETIADAIEQSTSNLVTKSRLDQRIDALEKKMDHKFECLEHKFEGLGYKLSAQITRSQNTLLFWLIPILSTQSLVLFGILIELLGR